ncbi:chemotaxis protein [Photobacterium nomapromontoriensis]|uniref:chemotaxis protein n=1 Tax=Photobacterium nomapromontoriensis TaxID=2910237 RepID=UPI003D0F8B95
MGGGGKSSSSNQTTNTNVSGQNAISGDNLGVAISGVNDSNINVTMTDHGAIERATELGELAFASNTEVTTAALEMGANSVSEALDFGLGAMELNAEVSNNAINQVSQAHGENLQMLAGLAGNQATQNSENLEALKELAVMKADGGQVATSKQMTIMVGIVMFFVAIMMIKGKR